MEFLSLGGIIKEQAPVALIGVYTDKITVSLVKREGGKTVVAATTIEPQEGEAAPGGILDTERIAFNCRKALATLPHTTGNMPRDAVFALGGGIGTFLYAQAKEIREAKEKKISSEELAAFIEAHTKGKHETVSRSFAENFHIDGFAVADPVGLNGGEMLVGIAFMACSDELTKSLSQVASNARLSVKGLIDMRYAAAKHAVFFEGGRDSAIVLCVFEHETHAVLVRNRGVAGSGIAPAGYGILHAAIEKTFSIGRQEAKEIMKAYADKKLDAHVSERAGNAFGAAGKELVAEIAKTVSRLDPTSLLPGNIRVISSEDVPQIDEAFRASEWLASLPIERNAAVLPWRAPEHNNSTTAFDALIAESL